MGLLTGITRLTSSIVMVLTENSFDSITCSHYRLNILAGTESLTWGGRAALPLAIFRGDSLFWRWPGSCGKTSSRNRGSSSHHLLLPCTAASRSTWPQYRSVPVTLCSIGLEQEWVIHGSAPTLLKSEWHTNRMESSLKKAFHVHIHTTLIASKMFKEPLIYTLKPLRGINSLLWWGVWWWQSTTSL